MISRFRGQPSGTPTSRRHHATSNWPSHRAGRAISRRRRSQRRLCRCVCLTFHAGYRVDRDAPIESRRRVAPKRPVPQRRGRFGFRGDRACMAAIVICGSSPPGLLRAATALDTPPPSGVRISNAGSDEGTGVTTEWSTPQSRLRTAAIGCLPRAQRRGQHLTSNQGALAPIPNTHEDIRHLNQHSTERPHRDVVRT